MLEKLTYDHVYLQLLLSSTTSIGCFLLWMQRQLRTNGEPDSYHVAGGTKSCRQQ